MNNQELQNDTVRTRVRERYGRLATEETGCGCAPNCCAPAEPGSPATPDAAAAARRVGYAASDLAAVPPGANLALGCGNPQGIAALRPGETVLDLGSGAGFDAFLAAHAVGSAGRVIGVDMTPEMVRRARHNQAGSAHANIEFRLGEIESLPVADATVDVILSNCVINLSPDKGRVFREAFRVLKPGGRLAISDIVALAPIPAELRADFELHTGCVAGAATVDELRTLLAAAGFTRIRIVRKADGGDIVGAWFPGRPVEDFVAPATIEAVKPRV